MSNLGPQQQNQSFSGLLQIPGGVTRELQQVQDGEGNTTGLLLSATGVGGIPPDNYFVPTINGTQITNSVARLVSDGFGDYISIKDFGATGDGSTDDTTAIQNALTYCASAGKTAYVPAPSSAYKITTTLNVSCSIVGEMPQGVGHSGQFMMTANLPALSVYGSRLRVENIGVEFAVSGTNTSTVGFLFGNSTTQFSRSIVKNCFVRYAYVGFKTNASGVGTVWSNSFENCHSDLQVTYGWYFSAVNGSTTQYFNNCYCIGDTTGGNKPKGFYFDNIAEIACGQIYADSCYNSGVEIRNCPSFIAQGIYFESPVFDTASSNLILMITSNTIISQIFVLGPTVDVGAGNRAGITRPAGDSGARTKLGLITVTYPTVTSGTLYKVSISAVTDVGSIEIDDSSITYSDIYENGYQPYLKINGILSMPSFAYIGGSWSTGAFVWNRSPAEAGTAGSKYVITGWSRITTGSGNVLNTDWVQSRVLTGN